MSHSETISNNELFKRAHKSFAFFMLMSGQDPVFVNSLTNEEKSIHWDLLVYSSSAQTHTWALNQKLETSQLVEVNHSIKNLSITSVPFPSLKFSKNNQIFKLGPDLPVRSAVTTAELHSPIWINENKINEKSGQLNLGDAVSLLTHELAHKLQRPDRQASVDSLAGKLKKFIDQNTQTESFDHFKVHVIKFPDNIVFGWLADLFGVRDSKNPKWIYDREGFYVILENQFGFQDLTQALIEPFSGYMKIYFDERNLDYQIQRMHWYSSDWVRLESYNPNHLKVSANFKYAESGLAFMKKNSLDPKLKRPYHSLYMSRPFDGGLIGFVQEFEVQKQISRVTQVQEGLVRHVDPTYNTQLIEKSWIGDDLKIVYKIEGPRILQFPGYRMSDMEIWPELLIEYQGRALEIRAQSFDTIKSEYTFIIPRLRNSNHGHVYIDGLELAAKKVNLVHGGSSSRVSAFLDKNHKIELSGSAKKSNLVLEKVVPNGEILEFIFKSNEKLRTLDVHQGITGVETSTYFDTSDSGIRYEVAERKRHFEDVKAVVRFSEDQMQQTLVDGRLTVKVQLDEAVETELEIMLEPDLTPEFKAQIRRPDKLTPHKFETSPDRWFLGFKAQTESLGVFDMQLERPLQFQKEVKKKSGTKACKKVLEL